MESSEDDAGTATSASRRASAREKDVGLAEDVDAARNFQHESSETRASCGTPAMSEDNFDGDSVPSPSSKETSTEAILDMIDDFIGDPRAPRLPLPAAVDRVPTPPVTLDLQHNLQSEEPRGQITTPPREPSPAPIGDIETLSDNNHVQPTEAECTTRSEILICVNTSNSEESTQGSSSVQVNSNDSGSTQQPEISQNVILEVLTEEPVMVPPSSSVETVQVTSDTSECDSLGRTVKCVTSSENRDSVTVELAESTSSECSVSESKALSMEPTLSRSPLKRRLIRPAPSDRRPDSTVSSTVDSHTDIDVMEQTSDAIAKDVSSSSDAVPIHGITKPEEISNISEISICKAETSTTSLKKIKLVRPKVAPMMSNSVKSETQSTSGIIERDRCQSTSSDEISMPSAAEVDTSSSNIEIYEQQENSAVLDISTVKQQPAQISEMPHISVSEAVEINVTLEKQPESPERPQVVELSPPSTDDLPLEQSSALEAPSGDTQMIKIEKQTRNSILKNEELVPPMKLSVEDIAMDVTEAQCSSTHFESTRKFQDFKSSPSPLADVSQTPATNCDHDNQLLQEDCETKVPNKKITQSNEDHSIKLETSTTVQTSQIIEDEFTSYKTEESTKQIPKLTIKLTNKYTEEVKSPVPKLTIKPLRPPVEQHSDDHANQQVPSVTKINIKPITKPIEKIESVSISMLPLTEKSCENTERTEQIPNISKIHIKPISKPTEKVMESLSTSMQSTIEQNINTSSTSKLIPSITKINIKPIPKPFERANEREMQPSHPITEDNAVNPDSRKEISSVMKLNIKPLAGPAEKVNEIVLKSIQSAEQDSGDSESSKHIPSITKINIKPIIKQTEKVKESVSKASQPITGQDIEDRQIPSVTKLNIKPIPKPAENVNESISKSLRSGADKKFEGQDAKQIPSITKINIKPITKPPVKENESTLKALLSDVKNVEVQEPDLQIPSVTKINIKAIPKPSKNANDGVNRPHSESIQNDTTRKNEQIPVITKLNIKPIIKPPEKINEIHRKSSSSEISESECSENDESTSTSDQASVSDQASTSDQGLSLDAVPKLTIKLGKPGTESEGKFYTEKNVPKLTIKNIQQTDKDDQESKLKLVISQSEDKQQDKVPKITIKTFTKSEGQPLSPKLTIKPLKPPESSSKDNEILKLKISADTISSSADVKENVHVPKITIKPVTKTDGDGTPKTPKKSTGMYDSSDHIPVVTKLNIKPILKPTESGENSETYDEKVPVVSKLNIKPVIKPKDNEVDSSIDDVPKITKLNIKPIKNPEESSSDKKDCDEMNADKKDSCIPVVTKLNIKPIVKPVEEEASKDSENQSSETGNSSDENADHIPVVTKLNIKPIVKPTETEESTKSVHNEQCIPVVTKLNIKPLIKPEEQSPTSPRKESFKSPGSAGIPVLTKLNIKPIVKPDDLYSKLQEENVEKSSKPPLLMKINMKNVSENEHLCNNVAGKAHSPKSAHSPKATKRSAILETNSELGSKPARTISEEILKNSEFSRDSPSLLQTECFSVVGHSSDANIVPEILHKAVLNSPKEQSKSVTTEERVPDHSTQELKTRSEQVYDNKTSKKNPVQMSEVVDKNARMAEHYNTNYSKASILNYTLLKKLLSTTKEIDKSSDTKPSNCVLQSDKSESTLSNCKESKSHEEQSELLKRLSPNPEILNDLHSSGSVKMRSIEDVHRESNDSITKPLEIITDKIANQSSGQDSPRIILKINKTDQGASAKIITEETHKSTDTPPPNDCHESGHITEPVNDTPSPKKQVNSRRKAAAVELAATMTMGKRLRSSRIVENAEKSPVVKRNAKRPSAAESPGPLQQKESELSVFETKRMKLEQLLSANKSLTITPVVSKVTQTSPSKSSIASIQGGKISHNHTILNNENSQKNGNSKLQNILSNLQAKQLQTLQLNDTSVTEKAADVTIEVESGTSTGSSDVVVEITRVENCHQEVQEMIINENSVCDLTGPEEVSQDPLQVENTKASPEEPKEAVSVQAIEMTPTPRKRGRPRKLPLPEAAKPVTPAPLPVPALEERPQRSLRLTRERPTILRKPRGGRGRGRGRGGRRAATPPAPSPEPEPQPEPEPETEPETVVVIEVEEARAPSPIDPTSSRIKLPRMTEALDKSVAGASCATPLSSRRRSSSSQTDLKLFSSAAVVLDSPVKGEEFMKSPEATRPRSGRGSRGGRGRTPRNRGRGRGGGRGAMYMKETMGIYGRVCGPATTTVQLFEEETCMMDDNATPSKPSHILDEDSQSSVKSSTNDSSKTKKSKFADLFDSNKVWTAADVKEYTWPPPDTPNAESQVMMIQEQVAMFLGVKSFKRRYLELKRRPVGGDEREYVLSKGLVSEALCDLGITAVDASEVLDIMLSDYPHKYEEYRSYQRQRQAAEETVETKVEERPTKVEIKSEKTSDKPEPPKVDPEKTRQDMAAAAIASAAEWNARANAWRRPACVDLQSNTIHRRRPPPAASPAVRVEPPGGFYPHALLPGQFQHWYRTYTAEQLRYFPVTTVLAAPPAPPSPVESSSESEASWEHSSSSEDDDAHHHSAKRKKLSRKRSSQQDKEESAAGEVETCRMCKLRLEANRKHTHERFLVCANCNAKLHPACVALPADTIRKCRSYAWQCAECKSCCSCQRHQDDDKMLFCDLCDRGFHIYCVGLTAVPTGRWHCVECAICKSCGARDPNGLNPGTNTPGPSTPGPSTPGPSTPGAPAGPGEWHHQTRRGPGGHKVYSHSLCTPCARAYRIGRYCPLCERSFIGPKGTMQLVICKLCDRQLHQECVRQTVSSLRVLDYTCAECRRGGITSRAAAVRAAPRTIATLFMAKRRFNKYAHRQYLASRLQALQDAADADPEPPPTDEETSRDVADPLEGIGDDTAPPDD